MVHEIDYEVIPSLDKFFFSPKFVSLVSGPIGSVKTTAGIMKIIHHAALMAPCHDGVRRSRCVWIRNTREQLRDTSIPDFLKWIRPGQMGVFLKTEYKFIIQLGDIECEVLFRGLDDQNDVRRLLSLQASFIVFDEFREINPDIYNAAQGRVGRYPDKMMNGVGCVRDDGSRNSHLWGMTNPPDADTFWEELLNDPPANVDITIQPSGLSPEADWTKFLPDDYYDNLAQGKTDDWIDVYIHAKFGKSLAGQPVFKSFDRASQVASKPIKPMFTSNPLLVGVDAGLTPAAVIGEQVYDGRLVVYDALVSEDMGALRFVRERLKPLLTNKFPGRAVMVIIDPAAFQRVQTDERTVADIYKAEGFVVKTAQTNSITARIAAVEKFLTRVVDGKPGLLIDPETALPLVQAMAGKYRYRINNKGVKDDKPEKSHPWSDVCFVPGTYINTPQGPRPVEELKLGDTVCVPDGEDTVVGAGSHEADALVELKFSDGTTLTCTADHPFYVKSHSCFLRADELSYDHVLETMEDGVWASGKIRTQGGTGWVESAKIAVASLLSRSGKSTRGRESTAPSPAPGSAAAVQTALSMMAFGSDEVARTTTTGTSATTRHLSPSTSINGRNTTAPRSKGTTSTTKITTLLTTLWTTLRLYPNRNTHGSICYGGSPMGQSTSRRLSPKPAWLLPRGINPLKGANDTERSRGEAHGFVPWLSTAARRAARAMYGSIVRVGTNGTTAPLRVIKRSSVGSGRVYNLTTERTHLYYADGKLVHNCDAFQYLCLHADGGETFGSTIQTERREVRKVAAGGWT